MKKVLIVFVALLTILMVPVMLFGFVAYILKLYLEAGVAYAKMFEEFVGNKLSEEDNA